MACYVGAVPRGGRPFVLVRLRPARGQLFAGPAAAREDTGLMLIDTGSDRSGITADCASRLGMITRDTVPIRTPIGDADLPVYLVSLSIECTQSDGLLALPEDLEVFEDSSFWERDGSGFDVIGLLGVDALRHLKLELDGPAGIVSLG